MAPTPEAVQLARRLRDLRDAHRLTQADLSSVFSERSKVSVAAISSWESETKTKVPPEARLHLYALFFSQTDKAIGSRHLPDEQDLAPADRGRFEVLRDELVDLRDAATGRVGVQISATSTWTFETGPITIICPEAPADGRSPLAEDRNPNHTRLYRYADLDALMELWGHIRASNPELNDVGHRLPTEVVADDLSGDLVVLGGIAWNQVADRLQEVLDQLPFEQVSVPDLENGEIFRMREPGGQEFRPRWVDRKGARREAMDSAKIKAEQTEDAWRNGKRRELVEDVGLLARMRNPFNHSRTITICSGVYSRGVLGSVRTLTDIAIRKENEAYVARRFPTGSFAILMRVTVVNGEALSPDLENPENRLYEWSPNEVPAA